MTRLLVLLALSLPAYAQTNPALGTATSGDGAVIILYAKPGPCVGNARLAEHKAKSGAITPGCWLLTQNGVVIAFLDGEQGNIPASLMVWAKDI